MLMSSPDHCTSELCSNGRHFMPLGTIVVHNGHGGIMQSDTWNPVAFPEETIQAVIGPHVVSLLAANAVAVSYKAPTSEQHIYFRIYIGTTPELQQSPKKKTANAARIRDCWEGLLGAISRDPLHWEAKQTHDESASWPLSRDSRTLSEIFTDLAPPSPKQEYLDTVDDISPLLHYPLYSFQRATVAQMLEREISNGPMVDPTFTCLHSVKQSCSHPCFWVQPSTMEVRTSTPFYTSKEGGGILAEEMGAGKTVILLALIMTTKDHLSVPDGREDGNITLTSLSLRYCQSTHHRQLREQYSIGEPDLQMPSMAESLLHFLACHPKAVTDANYRTREMFHSSALASLPARLHPFYFDHPSRSLGVRKGEKHAAPPTMLYLTRATLVVVPASLYEQWKGEIYKFCRDGALSVLFAKDVNFQLPQASALANYDLVLSTVEWLSTTNRKSAIRGPDICRCPGDSSYPCIPLCVCQNTQDASPIFQCRWKRLVVDEGHNSAHLTTEYSTAASKLSVENRWIVTGTPTQNLIGSIATPRGKVLGEDINSEGGSWTAEDEKDMRRLGNMIGRYLRVEPFYSQREYFDRHVALPLRKNWKGARETLASVMRRCIIRHPIEVVEAEVNVPAMSKEIVLLHLEPLQLRTYNSIQSTIVTNAVDSERTDEDYIFHPKNSKFLQATFTNLLQSLFWHADKEFFDQDIEAHLNNTTESIKRAIERGKITTGDLELLKAAKHVLHEAVYDSTWRSTMRREDVPYSTTGIAPEIQVAFSRFGMEAPLYHPDRLLKLRAAVCEDVDISVEQLLLVGEQTAKEDELKEVYVQMQRESAIKKSKKSSGALRKNPDAGQVKARTIVKTRGSSSLFDARILSSSSSKINFVIQEVLTYGKDEKFLIFSSSLLSLLHLAEALQVANVSYLEYTSECSPDQRRVNISQFNNIPIYRVFLMELKHGARGLNLVAASRVLFLEPVWQTDVEAQAIKRVHRTGQTKAVVVKTLAIRNTVEEEMLERRAGIVAKTTRMPPLTEEVGMRRYIENPKFLMEGGNDINWGIPLVPVKNAGVSGRLRELANTTAPMEVDVEKRKRVVDDSDRSSKRVRFAAPGDDV